MPLSILDYKSIRFKKIHFAPNTLVRVDFPSINKAKAQSRQLGGAGKVIAAKSEKDFHELVQQATAAFAARAEAERLAKEEAERKAAEEAAKGEAK